MASKFEAFWDHQRYAVVGKSAVKPFPSLTYGALKARPGTTVYAVDATAEEIDGDQTVEDLAHLPGPVDGAVLEVPKEETAAQVEAAVQAGVPRVWIHMGRETPEALQLAEEAGMEVCSGTCAVQYVRGGFPHNLHRGLRKLTGHW